MTYERIKNNRINIMLFLAVVLLTATAVSAQQFSIRPKASRFAPQGNNAAANSVTNATQIGCVVGHVAAPSLNAKPS